MFPSFLYSFFFLCVSISPFYSIMSLRSFRFFLLFFLFFIINFFIILVSWLGFFFLPCHSTYLVNPLFIQAAKKKQEKKNIEILLPALFFNIFSSSRQTATCTKSRSNKNRKVCLWWIKCCCSLRALHNIFFLFHFWNGQCAEYIFFPSKNWLVRSKFSNQK